MKLTRLSGKFQPKPITKDMVRKHFGGDAKVSGFLGCYTVKTPMSKVEIDAESIKLVRGGSDVYQAVVTLVGEAWGGAKCRGSREFVLACCAHGEAWQVNIQPDMRSPGAALLRWSVAVLIMLGGEKLWPAKTHGGDGSGLLIALGAMIAFFFLKWLGKKKEQRKLETGGYTYPQQTHAGAAFADENALRMAGLI